MLIQVRPLCYSDNRELTHRIEELDTAKSDLESLFEGTRVATLFLDNDRRPRGRQPAQGRFSGDALSRAAEPPFSNRLQHRIVARAERRGSRAESCGGRGTTATGTRGTPVGRPAGHHAHYAIEIDGTQTSTVLPRVNNSGSVLPETLPPLFVAYQRTAAHTPSSPPRTGLGLGLFIAREIARAHGGQIGVRSADDSTTFEVTLPREARPVNTDALTT